MWKVFNFLFGWQYVWLKDLGSPHVCRVKPQPNGDWSGKIVSRSFCISKAGKISGGYLIQDWRPLTNTITELNKD